MKATTLTLALCLSVLLGASAWAQSGPQNTIKHSQTMHQYIVNQAYQLLRQIDPASAKRLEKHFDVEDSPNSTGGAPWDARTILAGAWREDNEDVVYGYGTANKEQWPDIDLSRKNFWSDYMYSQLEAGLMEDPKFREGLTTCSHFWDAASTSAWLSKSGISVDGSGIFSVMDDDNQIITIKPQWTTWDKAQRIFRPNWEIAVRDKWWDQTEQYSYDDGKYSTFLPVQSFPYQEVGVRYQSLPHLYNTGECYLIIPGRDIPSKFILTPEQRDRYVWEMLGRLCHLLADMSVPAHTHRDIHMGNLYLPNDLGTLGGINITIQDKDSYEDWIASSANAFWHAGNIQGGLLDVSNQSDPLFFLFNSMRERAASFASDDVDGYGPYAGLPRIVGDMLDRYNPGATYSSQKTLLMQQIRDNTLPYAIRATATLLAWFSRQLDMNESFEVRNVGAAGYIDFFNRAEFTIPFPSWGTFSGTRFNKQVGDPLSLRAHIYMHPQTNAKYEQWKSESDFLSFMHQYDERVQENQRDVLCDYENAQRYIVPTLQIMGEVGQVITNDYPSFRDPWFVDPSKSHDWDLYQPAIFQFYQPHETATSNGGVFLQNYEVLTPDRTHYSIRASKIWDRNTLAHKWPAPEVGDYIFQRWEPIYAELFEDATNGQSPPDPAFINPEQYDTKAVNFVQNTALVNAHVKAHRTSVGQNPPSNTNSQRKVSRSLDGVYHAVYESDGRIWYISSTDKGATWTPEVPVTEEGVLASRPTIASAEYGAQIACVVDDRVEIRLFEQGQWKPFYSAPVTMRNESTPALAMLGDEPRSADRSIITCLVWEDINVLKFSVLVNRVPIVDNQVLAYGAQKPASIDQPRFPSVAASVIPVSSTNPTQSFHTAWIENGSIFHIQLGVDRSQTQPKLCGWTPGSTLTKQTVHARTGSAGLTYPAKHAPSIAVNDLDNIYVAFDVASWYSPWPTAGTTAGSPGNIFAVRELPATLAYASSWNTTATIVSAANPAIALTSPTVGVRPSIAPSPKSSKATSLRITYNDQIGVLRTVKMDANLTIEYHSDGVDPSMTVASRASDGLLDVFSVPAAQPYDWHLLSSRNHLAKTDTRVPARMREILLSKDDGFSVFGLSDLRVIAADGGRRDVDWDPEHDSLQLGVNATVAGKMRTARIPTGEGASLRFRVERYADGLTDAAAAFIIRVKDAITGELLRLLDYPVDEQDGIARLEPKTLDLSAFQGRDVILEADVIETNEEHRIDIADRYALVDPASYEAELENAVQTEGGAPLLLQNSPNPFNPSTVIRFALPADAAVRLAVYDLLGRQVAVLIDSRLTAGNHEARFDASSLPSGVYIYQLTAGGRSLTRTMHLLK